MAQKLEPHEGIMSDSLLVTFVASASRRQWMTFTYQLAGLPNPYSGRQLLYNEIDWFLSILYLSIHLVLTDKRTPGLGWQDNCTPARL